MSVRPPAAIGALALLWAPPACTPAPAPPSAPMAATSSAAATTAPAAQEAEEEACHLGGAPGPGCPGAARAAAAPGGDMGCEGDPRVTPFARDLVVHGARHRLVIVGAEPPGAKGPGAQSPQMGINALGVRVEDQGGRPAPQADITLTATMPDHGHGGSHVQGRGRGATKRFAGIDLMMPGVWRFTFSVAEGRRAPDCATVHLCIPG